jgi:subtilisin family serine protease
VNPHGSHAFTPLVPVPGLPHASELAAWAMDGATGEGVSVAIVDSGVQHDHPRVGTVDQYVAFDVADGQVTAVEGVHDDLVGHGTACAGVVRAVAPECRLVSLRVLGSTLKGQSRALAAAIEWAIEQRIDVVNLSLSTANDAWYGPFHELADAAYYANTLLVGAINNVPRPSYPSEFAAVLSVAARTTPGTGWGIAASPTPPAEFGAHGIDITVPWLGGGTATVTGNSFAAPHVAGLVALMRSKHPWLTAHQVRTVLNALCENTETPSR